MWILALCLCNLYLFLLYSVEPILPLTLVVVAMCSSLSCITRHWLPGDCIWKFCCPCLNSILQITRVSQLAFFLRSAWSCSWISWVWERISNVESEFLRDYGFNKLVFIAESCVAPWSRTFWEVSELSFKIFTVTSVTCRQAFLPAVQLILFSWPVECETLHSTVGTWTVSRDMKH